MSPSFDPILPAFSRDGPFWLPGGTIDVLPAAPIEASPHAAALLGIVALLVLGGVLVVRDRLEGSHRKPDPPEETDERTTDPELVRTLVEGNGGRMRQSEIVAEVEWSKAKVSRLLSELEREGEITKLRIGRENLICLPGEEPTASQPVDTR